MALTEFTEVQKALGYPQSAGQASSRSRSVSVQC
jgi:hypothetical protein